jgi:predicted dehydrogenase
MTDSLAVAIIGCGLIGRKRAASLNPEQLVVCCDTNLSRAEELAQKFGAHITTDYREAIRNDHVDLVIVATVNAALAEISRVAIDAGKHVFVEKPGGISSQEVRELADLAQSRDVRVRVGFNHRFHPALQKARELVDNNTIGPLMFIRGRYGHGGRLGYDREWRANPELSGGGELIDQGVHLVDLAHWFLGEFTKIEGHAATYFWDMPVDDNAFISLRTASGQRAWLHVSCTEWKNLFSFEIYGRIGKLQIDGLGGSYGTERLTCYRMRPQMGPPETQVWEYPEPDNSWKFEMEEFLKDIRQERTPVPGLDEARASLEVVEQIYKTTGYKMR